MQEQVTQFVDFYRAGLRTAADLAKASLESAERLQQQQLKIIRSAIEESEKSTGELASVRSVDELMALQTRLAGSQWERMMEFWSGMWRAAGDNQAAMIGQIRSQISQSAVSLREAAAEKRERKSA
jgi:phasin family protein